MIKELKDRWIAALRSGKYKQGKKALRRIDDTYCCLGVLCDILDNTRWKNDLDNSVYSYRGASGVLVSVVETEVGMYEQGELIGMNDSGTMSFSKIADWIEVNL